MRKVKAHYENETEHLTLRELNNKGLICHNI